MNYEDWNSLATLADEDEIHILLTDGSIIRNVTPRNQGTEFYWRKLNVLFSIDMVDYWRKAYV